MKSREKLIEVPLVAAGINFHLFLAVDKSSPRDMFAQMEKPLSSETLSEKQ